MAKKFLIMTYFPELLGKIEMVLFWSIFSYFLGAIPFGLLLVKLMGFGNLKEIGSGNIGATNVLRTGSKKAALLTLIFDFGKGLISVILARYASGEAASQAAALMCVIGHCYPVWLRFNGGKGVATLLGVLLALHWPLALFFSLAWVLTALFFRISSLSALIATALLPLTCLLTNEKNMLALSLILSAIIFWRHKDNIKRLFSLQESKIGEDL